MASYLLGQDQIKQFGVRSAAFAEGDEPPKGGTPNSKRRTKKPIDTSFDLPPAEAIDYFESKKIVSKKVFNQSSKEAQQGAFTVARVYNEDILKGFKDELTSALKEGRTQQDTIKRFKNILSGDETQEMLGDYHLETVFRMNMGTAYDVGRRRALEDVADVFPFWQYHGVLDDRERPSHVALEGITLPWNHPFWDTHFGHWEFGCRCGEIPVDAIPDDYDPKNPGGQFHENGEPYVNLSYDEEGMPIRADVGTSHVDLTAHTKFTGISRGASLLTAIEAGVTRAEESRRQKAVGRSKMRSMPTDRDLEDADKVSDACEDIGIDPAKFIRVPLARTLITQFLGGQLSEIEFQDSVRKINILNGGRLSLTAVLMPVDRPRLTSLN